MSPKTKLQIEGFLLVLLSALVRPFRGKAEVVVQNPSTVAVANFTTNIGDMIMTTPVFHAIKTAYPDCRVVVIGAGKSKDVLLGNTDVDEYIHATDVWTALGKLSSLKPDLGVSMNPSPHEIALLYLSGAKGISVFLHEAFLSRAFRALSSLVMNVPYKPGAYVPSQYLKLVEVLGIKSTDTAKHLSVSAGAISKVKDDLKKAGVNPDAPFAVFAPGAGQVYREWETARFAEVARYARDAYGAGVVVAGGPGDKKLAKHFIGTLAGIPVFDGTSQTIEELKALISLAHVVVSNDSGIAYIAEAFEVPAIIIVGISDVNEHPKGSPLARVVAPAVQTIVVHSLVSNVDEVNVESARRMLDAIPVARVVKEFDAAWKTPKA
jgi:ADP-heptose:LPS heptosyltransferase